MPSMQVTVRLFAAMREAAGQSSVIVEGLDPSSTIADLRRQLESLHPELAGHVSLAAIDGEYVDEANQIGEAREVALIPPVSGG